jgi:protein TonB
MASIPYPNTAAPAAERHTLTIAFVAALHIAVLYTILVALDFVPGPHVTPEGHVKWVEVKPTSDPPPQQTPATTPMAHPDPGTVVKPVIVIDYPPPPGGPTGTNGTQTGGGTGDVFQTAMAIPGTHTIPDYPALDRRLNHEGTVSLLIFIDANGAITGASVTQSSGYDGLDAAAIAWVKAHWRYKPAMRGGAAIPSTARASVVFHLTTGRG